MTDGEIAKEIEVGLKKPMLLNGLEG